VSTVYMLLHSRIQLACVADKKTALLMASTNTYYICIVVKQLSGITIAIIRPLILPTLFTT